MDAVARGELQMTGSRRLPSLLAPTLIALMLAGGACGEGEEQSTGVAESGVPAIEITAPEDGATLESGDIEVSVSVSGFAVVDKRGEAAVAGEGHIYYYIDVEEIPTASGEPAVTEENTYHAGTEMSFAWEGVRPGTHTFAVQLVYNDDTPLTPPVIDEVTVTVE